MRVFHRSSYVGASGETGNCSQRARFLVGLYLLKDRWRTANELQALIPSLHIRWLHACGKKYVGAGLVERRVRPTLDESRAGVYEYRIAQKGEHYVCLYVPAWLKKQIQNEVNICQEDREVNLVAAKLTLKNGGSLFDFRGCSAWFDQEYGIYRVILNTGEVIGMKILPDEARLVSSEQEARASISQEIYS